MTEFVPYVTRLQWSIGPFKKTPCKYQKNITITILNIKTKRWLWLLIEIVTQTIFMSIFLQFAQKLMMELKLGEEYSHLKFWYV